MILATPKVGAKNELFFNKPASAYDLRLYFTKKKVL
jgi:hypothetical protein